MAKKYLQFIIVISIFMSLFGCANPISSNSGLNNTVTEKTFCEGIDQKTPDSLKEPNFITTCSNSAELLLGYCSDDELKAISELYACVTTSKYLVDDSTTGGDGITSVDIENTTRKCLPQTRAFYASVSDDCIVRFTIFQIAMTPVPSP